MSASDLASFRAYVREPLQIPYRGGNVYATPELTAGPTLAHTLRQLQQKLKPGGKPDASAYTEYALALQSAYREGVLYPIAPGGKAVLKQPLDLSKSLGVTCGEVKSRSVARTICEAGGKACASSVTVKP